MIQCPYPDESTRVHLKQKARSEEHGANGSRWLVVVTIELSWDGNDI